MRRRDPGKTKIFQDVMIIDTADEGFAIGRCQDGLIILVKGAVPGDQADVIAIQKRKGMWITKVTQLKKLSLDRVDPFCSHFGICGGCKWQHMSYNAQLKFKEKKVRDAFERIGNLDIGSIKPIQAAPQQTYYRNKLEFTASDRRWFYPEEMQDGVEIRDVEGVGFHLAGAYDKVLDIQHCYLQSDPSNDIRQFIKRYCIDHQLSFLNLRRKTGFLRNIIVRNTLDGQWMVIIVTGEESRDEIVQLVDLLVENFPQIISIYSCLNTKVNDSIHDLPVTLEFGSAEIEEALGNIRYKIGPKSFFQTNSRQALTLYTLAKEMAELRPEDKVLDLYCGVGSMGIFMADQCKQVVGIEQIPEAIEDAEINALLNGIHNISFVTGQVEMALDPLFLDKYGQPDIIFTDPPRAGMHPDVIKSLKEIGARKIIYISCNPATQARDIKMLSPEYQLISAVPVDMFPHTHHIECISLLYKA